jgi:MFS family permease
MSMGILVLPSIATVAALALAVDPKLLGLQIGLLYTVATLTSLAAGWLIVNFGACRTNQFALVTLAAGCAVASIPSLWALALGSAIMGMAYGLPNPAASHLLARFSSPRQRNLVFSLKQAGVPLGGMIAGLVAPAIAVAVAWQSPLILAALVALLVAWRLQRERAVWDDDRASVPTRWRLPVQGFTVTLRHPSLRWVAALILLLSGIQFAIITFAVVALVQELQYSAVAAGLVFALMQAVSMFARVGWGWIADAAGDGLGVILVLLCVLLLALVLAYHLQPETAPVLVALSFALLGAGALGWNGVLIAEAARMSPPGRVGEVTGVIMFFSYFGVMLGPTLFAFAQGYFGGVLPALPAIGAATVASIAAAVAARFARPSARSVPADA